MSDSRDCEALLVSNLDWVDRVVASLCRRNGLVGDDADDFASWARFKLVEDDYAILRKFRGESAVSTYLTVVLASLFREYRVMNWGRWRASAAAQRVGSVAIRLETLVHRDGLPLAQAAEILWSERLTDMGLPELARLLAELPRRGPLRPIGLGDAPLETVHSDEPADQLVAAAETDTDRRRAGEALREGVEQLGPEDGLILKMKYWEGMSVADVARALDVPQKPLYRRINGLMRTLRAMLEARGVTGDLVSELLESPGDFGGMSLGARG